MPDLVFMFDLANCYGEAAIALPRQSGVILLHQPAHLLPRHLLHAVQLLLPQGSKGARAHHWPRDYLTIRQSSLPTLLLGRRDYFSDFTDSARPHH